MADKFAIVTGALDRTYRAPHQRNGANPG